MDPSLYITGSCVIENRTVTLNGNDLLTAQNTILTDMLLEVYRHFSFNYPKFYKMDNLCKLGWLAAELLLQDKATINNYPVYQKGVVLANANSSLDADLKYMESIADIPSPKLFVYTLPNIVIGEICIRHGFKGENLFFVQPEFNAGFIHQQVSSLIRRHKMEACICGWIDVLENEYKAALFSVERNPVQFAEPFTTENLECLFINLS